MSEAVRAQEGSRVGSLMGIQDRLLRGHVGIKIPAGQFLFYT